MEIAYALLKAAQIAVGMGLNPDRPHSDLLGHQGFHNVFRTVKAPVRRLAAAFYGLIENRLVWLLLSDFRREKCQILLERVRIEVGRQQLENRSPRGQTSRIGND